MLYPNGDQAWRQALRRILKHGVPVAPRDKDTLEILHDQLIKVDMSRAVVTTPERRLNYRFMVAEALWILSGSNLLEPLQRFIKGYGRFSDDGITLAGAYGPKVVSQLAYVVNVLHDDRETRQAVLSIWERNPPASKDIPCTVAMSFSIRNSQLHQHVFMRSSDIWTGIPYDIFSFACIGLKVACLYNELALSPAMLIVPGCLSISITSSHLYMEQYQLALSVLASPEPEPIERCPDDLILGFKWNQLEQSLIIQRDSSKDQLLDVVWRVRP